MSTPTKPEMIEILRGTLHQVEREPDLNPKDPVVIEFKQWISHSLHELENEARAA